MEAKLREAIEADVGTAYALDRGYRIFWTNPAYAAFSLENGGEEACAVVGRAVFDFIPTTLQPFYRTLYRTVQSTNTPVRHDYECSSGAAFRRFAQFAIPSGESVVVLNTLVESADWSLATGDWSDYVADTGFVTQCSHCRRLRRPSSSAWDLVGAAFERCGEHPVTHGLCPVCMEYFFADQTEAWRFSTVEEALEVRLALPVNGPPR